MSRQRRERQRQYLGQRYVADVLAKAGQCVKGRAYTVLIRHDDWCDLLRGAGPCNCNPDIGDPKPMPHPEDN